MVSKYENPLKTGVTHTAFVTVNTPAKYTSEDVSKKAFPKSDVTIFIHGNTIELDGSKTHAYVFTMVQAKEVPPATIRMGWEDALKRLNLPWVDQVCVTTLGVIMGQAYLEGRKRTMSRKGEGAHRMTRPAVGSIPVLAGR